MNELYGSVFFPRDTDKNFMFGFDSIKANASEESTWEKIPHVGKSHVIKAFMNLSSLIMKSSLIQFNKTFNFVCIFRDRNSQVSLFTENIKKWK